MHTPRRRSEFFPATLEAQGCANYHRIVDYMSAKSAPVVRSVSGHFPVWYLSIVAVDPAAQGQGLGRQLLAPTLAEADRASALCYLETFSPRNFAFYERLGFVTQARFAEPTTGAGYAVMVRPPKQL